MDHAIVSGAHVGRDEADTCEKLALVPFDLCGHTAVPVPTRNLILEIVMPDDGLIRWPAHGSDQKKTDTVLQNIIG